MLRALLPAFDPARSPMRAPRLERQYARNFNGFKICLLMELAQGKPPLLASGVAGRLDGQCSAPQVGQAAWASEAAPDRLTGESGSSGEQHERQGNLPEQVDPLALVLSAPPLPGVVSSPTDPSPRADFVAAVEELVRRISWGGDRGSGTARIELGAGKMRGSIVVRTEGRAVSLELSLPNELDRERLARRLRERLEARGLEVAALDFQ